MSNDRRLSMPSGKLRLLAVDAGDVLDAGWVICLKYGTCTPSSFPFPPNIPCTMTQYLRSLVESILASTESGEDSFLFPLIDVLDKSPSSLTTDPHLRWKCLLALDKVCATHDILPTRYPRINNLAVFGESPNKHGGSADVWRGEVNGRTVAVKVTRRYSTVPVSQAREQFYREILVWGRLSHPNILPFLGVDATIFPLAAVSVWMQHGNLKEFLVCFPDASRLKLILDASRGLEYMHGLGYVHGDLKSFNILVDDSHSARLADFGSSSILPLSDPDGIVSPTIRGGNAFSVRWLAPELVFPEKFGLRACMRSKESDVYALAMVVYEVFSGLLPFEGYRDEGVILQSMSGARPSRPQGSLDLGLTDGVWIMTQECWDSSDRRWPISRIVSYLESSIALSPKVVGPDVRIAPKNGPTSDSQTELDVAPPSRWRKLFHILNQLFRTSPVQRAIRGTDSRLHK